MLNISNMQKINKQRIFVIIFIVFITGLLLSLMRDAVKDEALYLHETQIMAECLKNGQWFGNEAVGVHGFLFKFPAALLFIIIGHSVFLATFINLIYVILSIFLCYLIFKKAFNSSKWALAACFLIFTNYHFILSIPTFLREMPVLLSLLLFLYSVIEKKSKWIVAISLVLILDAKENVFFMILPGFILWIIIYEFFRNKESTKGVLFKKICCRTSIFILPSIIFLFFMFFTGVIPLNPKTAYILILNKGNVKNLIKTNINPTKRSHIKFKNEKKIFQIRVKKNKQIGPEKKDDNLRDSRALNLIWNKIVLFINFILLYVGKILYPRTFSFISVPKFMILPAVVMSFSYFKYWYNKREKTKLIFPLIFWSYLFIYILQWSVGRYIFPIVPLTILFFIYFLKYGMERTVFARNVLIATSIFVALGIYFENNYILIKIILNIVVLTGIFCIFYFQRKKIKNLMRFKFMLIAIIGVFTFSISIASSILLPRQVGHYFVWGYNSEYKKIITYFDKIEKIWINTNPYLLSFYRNEMYLSFDRGKKHLNLKNWVPKKKMLNTKRNQYTFHFKWKNERDFKDKIRKNNIETVAMIVSTYKNKKFRFNMQDHLGELKEMSFLKLDRKIFLKNKKLYIFRVQDV